MDVGDAGRTWAPRAKAGVVVFNDELYLLGGQGTADVWRSSNGRDWTQLAPEADWSPRHDFARLVYSERLWVFGGWTDKSTNALNDVWYSDDGMNWSRQTDHARGHPSSGQDVPRQDLDLQRQAHRRRRQLGRRCMAR